MVIKYVGCKYYTNNKYICNNLALDYTACTRRPVPAWVTLLLAEIESRLNAERVAEYNA